MAECEYSIVEFYSIVLTGTILLILSSVSGPDSLSPDPAFYAEYRYRSGTGSRVLMNKNCKNLQLKQKNLVFFGQKLQFIYPWSSIKDVQATGEAFIFVGHFCPPGSGSGSTDLNDSGSENTDFIYFCAYSYFARESTPAICLKQL